MILPWLLLISFAFECIVMTFSIKDHRCIFLRWFIILWCTRLVDKLQIKRVWVRVLLVYDTSLYLWIDRIIICFLALFFFVSIILSISITAYNFIIDQKRYSTLYVNRSPAVRRAKPATTQTVHSDKIKSIDMMHQSHCSWTADHGTSSIDPDYFGHAYRCCLCV